MSSKRYPTVRAAIDRYEGGGLAAIKPGRALACFA